MSFNFEGKNVFVTGADGFIGSHLVEALVKNGANVKALVYYNSWNQIGWLQDCHENIIKSIEIIKGDIRDSFFINESVKKSNYIFHLASLIGIPYSYHAAQSYIDTNVHGALNIAQASLKLDSLDALLHVSTSEVYGSAQYVPMNEDHPIVGQSPYSASKIAADKVIQSFHLSFGLPAVTARPFNTYGPRQTTRAVIPTIIKQVLNSSNISLGNLNAKRDFNYVTDTVNGMISLATCNEARGQEINIGSGEYWSIQEIIDFIFDITDKKLEVIEDKKRIRPKKSEVNELLCDNKKILSLTDWMPTYDIKDGLIETIDWIKQNKEIFQEDTYSI
jgi:NAD dependent epimerase/dehydratase